MLEKPLTAPLVVLAAALLLASPARADDMSLLTSGVNVPPNVMLVIDSSGSMTNQLWESGYNPLKSYASTCWNRDLLSGSSCPNLGNPGDECPNSTQYQTYDPQTLGASFAETCNTTSIPITLDPNVGSVRYANNYLNWVFGAATSGELANLPTDSRTTAAKQVLSDLVDQINPDDGSGGYQENVRFGVGWFKGHVEEGFASGNKGAVLTAVNNVPAGGSTPLWETLLDMGRYMAAENTLGPFSRLGTHTSPIDDACRRNFVILMTDGAPSGTITPNSTFMGEIGNADGDGNECSSAFPATCTDAPKTGRDDGWRYSESGGNDWLDDVAYYLARSDLSPLPGVQNLITYTVGFTIDMPLLQDAADNGLGKYYTTGDSATLLNELESAVLEIISRSYSFGSAAVPSSRTTHGDAIYWTWFKPDASEAVWEGHLEAYRLLPTGEVKDSLGNLVVDPTTSTLSGTRVPYWDAAELLKANTGRNLLTNVSGAKLSFDPNNMDETLLNVSGTEYTLYPNYPTSGINTLPLLADALTDFVHGVDVFDEDGDSDMTELRNEVMGDVFHSNPLVVAGTLGYLKAEDGYGTSSNSNLPFRDAYKDRDRVVYVGTNSGLLHAFHAGDFITGDDPNTSGVTEAGYFEMGSGAELFGWAPGSLLDDLKQLPLNTPRTQWYVDGNPIAADVWLGDPNDPNDTTKTPEEWATVLVTGMRSGGSSYLALDVTDPDATDPNDPHGPYPLFLWEFTHAQLGETWSEPVVTRVKLDDGAGGYREEWVAIFGGGFTDEGNPNGAAWDPNSLPGKGIFMVAMDDGAVIASVLYDPSGMAGPSNMPYAFPSTPAVLDLDFDGFGDVVYVGDLGGQMWKWNISPLGVDSGGDPRIDNWPAGVFFSAPVETLADGITLHYKSIFSPPSATKVKGKVVLIFGTGERENLPYAGDGTRDENNRFYVVRDPDGTSLGGPYTESNLTDITGSDNDTDATDLGFYFIARDGEKFITDHTIFSGFVITAGFLPTAAGGASGCGDGGESFLYVFDVLSGTGFFFDPGVTVADSARRISVGTGIPSSPRVSVSSAYSGSGGSGGGSGTNPGDNKIYIKTSSGQLIALDAPPPNFDPMEVVYWKQNF
jgi:type IV pilus assembly protein PilY1